MRETTNYCDRCRQQVDTLVRWQTYGESSWMWLVLVPWEYRLKSPRISATSIELCESCVRDMEEWVNEVRGPETTP